MGYCFEWVYAKPWSMATEPKHQWKKRQAQIHEYRQSYCCRLKSGFTKESVLLAYRDVSTYAVNRVSHFICLHASEDACDGEGCSDEGGGIQGKGQYVDMLFSVFTLGRDIGAMCIDRTSILGNHRGERSWICQTKPLEGKGNYHNLWTPHFEHLRVQTMKSIVYVKDVE